MYHKRQSGQSKEKFSLVGGTHNRGHGSDRVAIRAGDILHITKAEAEKFSDRFEVVELPVSAADVTIPEEEESQDEDISEEDTSKEDTSEEDTSEEEPPEEIAIASTADPEVVDAVEPDTIDRQDFSSDKSYQDWVNAGEPDMSKVARTGHGGRTYSVKDVKNVA